MKSIQMIEIEFYFCIKTIVDQARFHTLDLDASGGAAGCRASQSSSPPVQTWTSVRQELTAAEWDKSVTTSPAATAATARRATSTTAFAKPALVRMESAGWGAAGWRPGAAARSSHRRLAMCPDRILPLIKCHRTSVSFTFC